MLTNIWLNLNNYIENVLKLRKFWIFLINLLILYGLFFMLCYIVYLLIIWKPLIFNMVIMLVLMIGMMIDTRFSKKSVFLLIGLIIIQLVVYRYLELIPILIIKDIFWFSVVLNISFIWHMCILQWMFKVSDLMKWELLMFITRSWGVLTSMTFILWIINWIDYIRDSIERAGLFMSHEEDIKNWYKKRNLNLTNEELEEKTGRFIHNCCLLLVFWEFVMWLFRNMVLYFTKLFYNYSMLITGKKNISLKDQPIQAWLFIIVTIAISIWIMVPRLYIIWVILIIFEIRRIYKIIYKYYNKSCKPLQFEDPAETKRLNKELCKAMGGKWNMIRLFILKNDKWLIKNIMYYNDEDEIYYRSLEVPYPYYLRYNNNVFYYRQNGLYVKNYTRFYQDEPDYDFFSSWTHEDGAISMFDLCDLFIYRKDMIKNIVGNWIIGISHSGRDEGFIAGFVENFINTDDNRLVIEISLKNLMEHNPDCSIEELNEWKKENNYMYLEEYGDFIYRNYVDKTTGAFHRMPKDMTLWEYLFGVDEGRYLYGCFGDPGKVYISKKYIKK